MAVDRVHGADEDADKGQEQPASYRRLPRDQPGTEPKGMSRADSRAAAAAANEAARQQEAGETSSTESGRRWRTVAEEAGEVRSYPSFDAAGRDLGVRPGKELHHIVEQNQARPERSGFGVVRINTTDNLVYLPADVHAEVSRHYSTRQFGSKATVRDSLTGKTWEHQHQYGHKAIDEAWRRVRSDGEA